MVSPSTRTVPVLEQQIIAERKLADGSSWRVDVVERASIGVTISDAFGDVTSLAMNSGNAAELRDAVTGAIIATGRSRVGLRSDVLAGAMRRNLELLRELEKTAPEEVDRILVSLLAHIRSWRPQVLLSTEVMP